MRGGTILIAVFLAWARALAAGPGTGYGEALSFVMPARLAATAGIAVEDPPYSTAWLAMTSVNQGGDLKWYGLDLDMPVAEKVQAGVGYAFFSADGGPRMLEDETGKMPVSNGEAVITTWGLKWRLKGYLPVGQYTSVYAAGQALAGRQTIDEFIESDYAIQVEAGLAQVVSRFASARSWVSMGPAGLGRPRPDVPEARLGASLAGQAGLMEDIAQGYAIGMEGRRLEGSRMAFAAGGVYWCGSGEGPGAVQLFRAGICTTPQGAAHYQPYGGVGFRWTAERGRGIELDYAARSLGGGFGTIHYVTLSLFAVGSEEREADSWENQEY